MALNLEEQEQLEELKAWWKKYGNLLTWLVIIGLFAYAGFNGWKYYQRGQAEKASLLYEEMFRAVVAKDNTIVMRAATDLETQYSGTAYAQMAGMIASRAAYEAGEVKSAKAQLEWVANNAVDDEYKVLAKLRLAGMLLDEKAYDDGVKWLSGDFPEAFAARVADRKGDILVAQGKIDEARTAYQLALDKSDPKDQARKLIQLKLDGIGGPLAKSAK